MISLNLFKKYRKEDKIKALYREKISERWKGTRTFLISRNERNDHWISVTWSAFIFTCESNYEQCLSRYCNLQSRV